MEQKFTCSLCFADKPLSDYHKNSVNQKRWPNECKQCKVDRKERAREEAGLWLKREVGKLNHERQQAEIRELIKTPAGVKKLTNRLALKHKRKTNPWYRLVMNTRSRDKNYLTSKGMIKSKNTIELLGVETWEQYIKHLESTLAPGLSWDDNIHNDHSLPLSWATPGDMDELMMITNYRNRRLITENENCAKRDRYGVLHDGRIILRDEYEAIKAEGKLHTICPWYKSTKQDNITG